MPRRVGLFIVADVDAVIATASEATRAASVAFWEISRIDAPVSSLPAETVSTLRDICSAAAETANAWAEVSSADAAFLAASAVSAASRAVPGYARYALRPGDVDGKRRNGPPS